MLTRLASWPCPALVTSVRRRITETRVYGDPPCKQHPFGHAASITLHLHQYQRVEGDAAVLYCRPRAQEPAGIAGSSRHLIRLPPYSGEGSTTSTLGQRLRSLRAVVTGGFAEASRRNSSYAEKLVERCDAVKAAVQRAGCTFLGCSPRQFVKWHDSSSPHFEQCEVKAENPNAFD
jgi:hypothetical protein